MCRCRRRSLHMIRLIRLGWRRVLDADLRPNKSLTLRRIRWWKWCDYRRPLLKWFHGDNVRLAGLADEWYGVLVPPGLDQLPMFPLAFPGLYFLNFCPLSLCIIYGFWCCCRQNGSVDRTARPVSFPFPSLPLPGLSALLFEGRVAFLCARRLVWLSRDACHFVLNGVERG